MNFPITLKVNKNNVTRQILIFAISFLVIFSILASYNNILALTKKAEYIIIPSKKTADYEKLTLELISLYGSGRVEYYQDNLINHSDSSANAYQKVSAENYLYIPNININTPIVIGNSTDQKVILSQLKEGVILYPGSSLPGQGGTSVIIGHSSSNYPWQKYSSVFSSLPKLSKGDMIVVNFNGKKYAYNVDRKITGSVNSLASQNISGDLILGTCWPIGTDEKRILVIASLIK